LAHDIPSLSCLGRFPALYYEINELNEIRYRVSPMKTPLLLIIACIAPVPAWTDPAIIGPVAAKVVKVYDGDTFTVEAYPWPGLGEPL